MDGCGMIDMFSGGCGMIDMFSGGFLIVSI
jgi:hypothetical protein